MRGSRRLSLWAAAGLGVVLLVLGAAATFGPTLLNVERYRGQIARQVGRAIGRDVTVGAITANLWRLGAEAQGIRVADRPGYGATPFLEAEALRVRVELVPLLRGNLQVATAVLERPRIHLVRDRAGRWNIEDLWPHAAPGAMVPGPGRASSEARRIPPPTPGVLLVHRLRARGGEIQIDDLRRASGPGASLAIRNLRLDAWQADPRDAVSLELSGEVQGGALEAAATLAPRGQALAVDARAAVRGLDLAALAPYLASALGGEGASGPANVSLTAKGVLPALEFAGDLDLTRARLDLGPLARKVPEEEGRLTFAGRMVGDGADLPNVRLRWRGMAVEGKAAVARFQPLEMTFDAETAKLDLDHLLPPASPPALEKGKTRGASTPFGAAVAWGAMPSASPRPAAAPAGARCRVRADGTFRAAALRWHGLDARDVRGALAYRDAILGVQDVTGTLAGGHLAASGTVDLRARRPALAATFRLEEAQLQPVAAALARTKFAAQGTLTAEGKVSAAALEPGSVLGALAGSGSFVVRDGQLKGYKPLDRLEETLTSSTGGAKILKTPLGEFQRLSATVTMNKGSLRTKDLTLLRPDGEITAAGNLNLLDTALDFDVVAHMGKVTLEAKVLGTTGEPLVVPTVARLDKRFEMEIDRALKGERGKKVQDLLRNLLR